MKIKINIISLFIFTLFLVSGSHAQNKREKIEALRASFISKKLNLSTAESANFWPVYNEFNDKLKALKRNLRQAYANLPLTISDKEAEEIIILENKSKLAEAELTKTYNDKLKAIIGAVKLVKLQIYEEEFKKEVIKTIREN